MAEDTTYNGWTNRETWLVALWINNEQGWQESCLLYTSPSPRDS